MSCTLTYTILDIFCDNLTYDVVEYTDGVEIWRKGVRGSNFVLDHALTPTGFAGQEDLDWECVRLIPKPD